MIIENRTCFAKRLSGLFSGSRFLLALLLLVFGITTADAGKPPPKEPKRYAFTLSGSMSAYFETANQAHTASPKRQVKAAAWVGEVDLDEFFKNMEFKENVSGEACFPNMAGSPYGGEFHVNWDGDGTSEDDSTSATFWLDGFAADGPDFTSGTPIVYRLDFIGEGYFSSGLNPTELELDEQDPDSTSMTAKDWVLTSTAKGKLRKFTCTGASWDSETDDLNPFAPVVTITVTRLPLLLE